jgi:hypothetical protein
MTFPPLPGFISGTRVAEPDYVLLGVRYSNADPRQPFALGLYGDELRPLLVSPNSQILCKAPLHVSPDGEFVLPSYESASGELVPDGSFVGSTMFRLGRLESEFVRYYSQAHPDSWAFSYDGSLLFRGGIVTAQTLYERNAAGDDWDVAATLTRDTGGYPDAAASIHPDNDMIVGNSSLGGGGTSRGRQVWAKVNGQWEWRQYLPAVRSTFMAFRPTGDAIIAEGNEDQVNQFRLWMWDRVGADITRALDIPEVVLGSLPDKPQWSPDGNHFAFRAAPHKVWVFAYSDRTLTRVPIEDLIPEAATVLSVAWAPDSSMLCLCLDQDPFVTLISIGAGDPAVVPSSFPIPPIEPYQQILFHPAYPLAEV